MTDEGGATVPPSPPALAFATAPTARPARGAAVAVALHAAVLTAILILPPEPALRPPADNQVITLVLQAAPPPTPKPAPPAAAPPLPITPKADAAALPMPPPPLPPPPPQRRAAAVPPAIAVPRTQPAPARTAPVQQIATIPAQPDATSDNMPPDYPEIARDQGEVGRVLLRIRIDPFGEPLSVTVVRSTGYRVLDQAAQEAVRRWHFDPARKTTGQPVGSTLSYWFAFTLGPD